MQSAKEKFIKGLISEEEFKNEAMTRSVNSLKEQGYVFIENLGSGTYGTVFYARKHTLHNRNKESENLAVKIVLQENVNKMELEVWRSLKNENVLPLNNVQYIPSAGTFAFFMPLIPTSLDVILEDSVLAADINGFDRALSYLQDVLKGIKYLHSRKLCHLDVKPSNILISYSGKALLCDFSSLTMIEAGTDNYVSPFLYRPPEAIVSESNQRAVVNGFSYDVYTAGFLALEIFTNEAALKSCQSIDTKSAWSEQVYPKVFQILKKKNFENAVNKAFWGSNLDKKLINIMRNFIKGCLCLNPRFRPSLDHMIEHKIFRGVRLFQEHKNDIWEKKVASKKLNFLISLFVAQASSLNLPSDSASFTKATSNVNHEEKEKEPRYDRGDPIQSSNVETKPFPECVPEAKLSKKHMFMQWIADKKAGLYGSFSRIISTLRRSSK